MELPKVATVLHLHRGVMDRRKEVGPNSKAVTLRNNSIRESSISELCGT